MSAKSEFGIAHKMKVSIFAFWDSLVAMVERHPKIGYIGAAIPTATGFWTWVEHLTRLGALLSLSVGLIVGILTLQVQMLQKRKLKLEMKRKSRPNFRFDHDG